MLVEMTARSELSRLNDPRLLRELSYVNGKWCGVPNGATLEVTNPADGAVLGAVAALDAVESRKAVDVADAAFGDWSRLLPQDRASILRRWYELMLESAEDLALLMTMEQGKPISEARGEIEYAASFIEYYAEEAKRPNIESVTSHLQGAEVEVWREPTGVAALITPWNFPSAMLTRKAAAAMAAGCTVVAHPSKETPFSALALAELAERAGVPAGVLNVVTGRASELVRPWTEDPRVGVLSFTGSTEIGRLLYRQSASTIKRLVMELGGHAPFLVFADADLEKAVDCAISAKFATSGQDCLAANRFLIERPVYAEFCARFAARVAALPGVESVGLVENVPLNEGVGSTRYLTEKTAAAGEPGSISGRTWAGPGYFSTMGIEVVRGREFTEADHTSELGNVIVSETTAELLWPGANPLGRRLAQRDSDDWATVVGVVEDVLQYGFRDDPQPLVYFPLVGPTPDAWRLSSPAYVVKSERAADLAPEIRALVTEIAPGTPMYRVFTMEGLAAESMERLSFTMLTLGATAVLALLLGTIGLYGVLSYVVAERTREIGVRMALGADARRVLANVVRQGVGVVFVGVLIGAAFALGTTRVLGTLLYDVEAIDAETFLGMSLTMMLVGVLASYVPARRAASVDPVESMRGE